MTISEVAESTGQTALLKKYTSMSGHTILNDLAAKLEAYQRTNEGKKNIYHIGSGHGFPLQARIRTLRLNLASF